jgi:Zn-dependent protease with chaperone function
MAVLRAFRNMTPQLLVLTAALPALVFCQTPSSGINFYSIAREVELGKTISDSLRARLTIIDEPEVARLTTALAPHAAGPFQYHVLVFDDAKSSISTPVLTLPHDPDGLAKEPLTVAGGWVFVPASLLKRIGAESQLAAILAHSMVHVAMRHSTRLATKNYLLQLGVDELPENIPAVVPVAMEQGLPLAFVAFARSFELQADAMAVDTLAASGYDPHALIDYSARCRQSNTTHFHRYQKLPYA